MKELVECMAKALVDDPTSVSVTETDDGRQQVLELRVGEGESPMNYPP